MIRSVNAGGTSLNSLPQRKPQQPQSPFPKINGGSTAVEEQTASKQDEVKSMMVGVKPKSHLQSILDEKSSVVRLNADGDRLDVSKKAISLAKEYLM